MRYIVTDKKINLKGYIVVDTISDVKKDCDVLIYNKSGKVSDMDILDILKVKDFVEKKIYVSKEPNVLYSAVFKSIGGVVCEDEGVLLDQELLDYLTTEGYEDCNIDNIVIATKALDKCLKDIQDTERFEENQLYKKELWVNEIKAAVKDIHGKLKGVDEFSSEVIKVFNNLNAMLQEVNVSKEAIATEMMELKKAMSALECEQKILLEENKKSVAVVDKNTTRFRLKYTVPSTVKKIVYVKEYSECRYLTSFFICYRNWVKAMLKKDFKIILIIPDEYYAHEKYREFAKVDTNTVEYLSGDDFGICTITQLQKSVVDEIIKRAETGVIFIDKTFDEKQLIGGAVVHKYGAMGNLSVFERSKLKPNQVFMSIDGVEGSMIIPHFESYADQTNDTAKQALYNGCVDTYKKLNIDWGV